jgi:hypothetical protein
MQMKSGRAKFPYPREVVKSEKCYVDLSGHTIGPVAAIDKIVSRLSMSVRDLLLTYSSSDRSGEELYILNKSAKIQNVCWQAIMAIDNKNIMKRQKPDT